VIPKSSEAVENASFFVEMRPNRSLKPSSRRLWFFLIASTTLLFSVAATAIGAWMALPFAGFEVLFLWWAFRLVGKHDGDYEWVRVANREFSWARCSRGRIEELCGNAAWVQVLAVAREGRIEIGLRYLGKTVSVGQLISDEQRRLLCSNLVRALK
jgi:uncharacterized membrane protein